MASGSIKVFVAVVLKAFHKIIMGVFQVDYIILDKQFTPTQSVGFILLFLALLGMFTSHNTKHISKATSLSLLPVLFILEEEVG